jgi:hypothetical protein
MEMLLMNTNRQRHRHCKAPNEIGALRVTGPWTERSELPGGE